MELYIRIEDGNPVNHPIMGDNFRQCFPEIDTENLPPQFAKFVRVDVPEIGIFQVYEGSTYTLVNGVWTDFHNIRNMNSLEKQQKINNTMALKVFPSWTLDEETLIFHAPLPYPDSSKLFDWDEKNQTWVEGAAL